MTLLKSLAYEKYPNKASREPESLLTTTTAATTLMFKFTRGYALDDVTQY